MKQLSDYMFSSAWQIDALNITSYEDYVVLKDVGDLRTGEVVKFIGFADVDNHYGIFVFTDSEGRVLEVPGDYSGRNSSKMAALKAALSKKQAD